MEPNQAIPESLTLLSMEDILDQNMSAVEVLAGYQNPVDGTYGILLEGCKLDVYTVDDEPGVQKYRLKTTYAVVNCFEKSKPTDADTPRGSKFTENFQVNAVGLGIFKAKAAMILGEAAVEGMKLGDTIKAVDESAAYLKARINTKETPRPADKIKPGGSTTYRNLQVRFLEKLDELPDLEAPGNGAGEAAV